MVRHDAFGQGETDPGALGLLVEALEEPEDLRGMLRRDPDTLVAHEAGDVATRALEHAHLDAGRLTGDGELKGILHEVLEHLAEPRSIAEHVGEGVVHQHHRLLLRDGPGEEPEGLGHELAEGDTDRRCDDAPDPRQLQQVVEELLHRLDAVVVVDLDPHPDDVVDLGVEDLGGQAVFGTEPKLFPTFMETEVYELGPIKFPNTNVLIVLTTIVLMTALTLFVTKTRPGAAMRACSHHMKTARLMGINVNATISLTFGIGSAMAAVAGVLVAMDQPAITPLMGVQIGLKAFVAAVVGGIGSIPGAALGGLILGVSESVVGGLWETSYAEAVAFVFLIVVLLFKPSGLLGKATREKV